MQQLSLPQRKNSSHLRVNFNLSYALTLYLLITMQIGKRPLVKRSPVLLLIHPCYHEIKDPVLRTGIPNSGLQ